MRTPITFALAAGILACASPAPASVVGQAVSVELRMDDGRTLNLYPAGGTNRVYAEAVRGAGYTIVVHNRTGRRVGLCIAVDGRNIISGAKSWLGSNERMYLLDPYATEEYSGWRTGQDRVNRFFFTTSDDSYAGAFGDTSAMGVVAMAVYPEVRHVVSVPRPYRPSPPRRFEKPLPDVLSPDCVPGALSGTAGSAAAAPRAEAYKESRKSRADESAGTGYGREESSPSVTVPFEAESTPLEKTFIKYEWRDTLRRLGVIRDEPPRNRFWNEAYAPPPPRRY